MGGLFPSNLDEKRINSGLIVMKTAVNNYPDGLYVIQ